MSKQELSMSFAYAMLDAVSEPVSCWSRDFECVYANKAWLKLFSLPESSGTSVMHSVIFPPSQPCGTTSMDFLHHKSQRLSQNNDENFPFVFHKFCGTQLPCTVHFSKMQQTDDAHYIMKTSLEPTKEALTYTNTENTSDIQSYERMQLLLKHLPIGVDLWDQNFRLYDCNEASLQLFGVSDKQEYIDNFMSFTPELQPCGNRSADLIPQHLQHVFDKGHHTFEWQHINKAGEKIPVEISIIRTKNEDNEDVAVVYYKDLREVKHRIDGLKKIEQRLSDILNSAPYAITTWDKNFQPVDCNLATVELFGFKNKQDCLQHFFKIFPEFQKSGRKSIDVFEENFTKAFREGFAFVQGELVTINNTMIFVEVTLKKLYIDDAERIIVYLTDFTVQQQMRQEIQESHSALLLARNTAEKNARIKGEFLANMSHEIRTPMNGILGLLHLLSLTEMKEQQQFYVDKILYSAESLLRIINDILDFSKIEAGKLEMEQIPFTLKDLRDELYTLFEPKLAEKNIYGKFFAENDVHTKLIGDPLRLKQVFLNLIGNAIKFTEKGSVVVAIDDIIAENTKSLTYFFSVKDSGIGLSKEQCNRLFNAFAQADASTTRKYGGTGLGLIISKRIVEMMQGRIWVESEEGQGATFKFTATFDLDMNTYEENPAIYSEEHIEIEETLLGKILLVEDNPINQIIAMELLTHKGHSVDIAQNGQEAIEMLEKTTYDIVFMDIQMPVMDGLTATMKIRENPLFKKLPIIAMSAHAMKGDREISINHGMNDHLSKPIQPEALYACIHSWLAKK